MLALITMMGLVCPQPSSPQTYPAGALEGVPPAPRASLLPSIA